jgi:glycosyltransferase involved in cell wall biosynthesis
MVDERDTRHVGESEKPLLSICIATYKRGAYIGATLDAILRGLPERVEVVILDGASPDNTEQVVKPFTLRNRAVRYIRETVNSGFDADFDKVVCHAHGTFCWLTSDDDILIPGAIEQVLARLEPSLDLLVVNAQVRSADLSVELKPRMMEITEDRVYESGSGDAILADTGGCLAYVGAVVIKRSVWLERDRQRYFGSYFVHVGVIFQAPLSRVKALAEPLIMVRAGNSMWTPRGFEIWMFLWPNLIWSFDGFSDTAKRRVVAREPWREWRQLTMFRAIGAFSYASYLQFFKTPGRGGMLQRFISVIPPGPANALIALYWCLAKRSARTGIYDLVKSKNASGFTRLIARLLDIPTA